MEKCTFSKNGRRYYQSTISGKGLRNGPRNEPMLLFLAQTMVSCSNSAHTRGAVREPQAMVIGTRLTQGGHPFLNNFLKPFFHSDLEFWMIWLQNEPPMLSSGRYFLRKCENHKNQQYLNIFEDYSLQNLPVFGCFSLILLKSLF